MQKNINCVFFCALMLNPSFIYYTTVKKKTTEELEQKKTRVRIAVTSIKR